MRCSNPDWVVLHIAHDSKYVPSDLREQFLLSDEELDKELLLMTDARTRLLFNASDEHNRMIVSSVSRLVVDVERFADDELEIMSQKGMGAIYTKTADGRELRRKLNEHERNSLLSRYYKSHHLALEREVEDVIQLHGQCLIIDCHSFPSKPLPCDLNQSLKRPDICIGTDSFHTPEKLSDSICKTYQDAGYSVAMNEPYSGTIVPLKHYGLDDRVQSVMVEVNRSLYMDERSGKMLGCYDAIAEEITSLCVKSIDAAIM